MADVGTVGGCSGQDVGCSILDQLNVMERFKGETREQRIAIVK